MARPVFIFVLLAGLILFIIVLFNASTVYIRRSQVAGTSDSVRYTPSFMSPTITTSPTSTPTATATATAAPTRMGFRYFVPIMAK